MFGAMSPNPEARCKNPATHFGKAGDQWCEEHSFPAAKQRTSRSPKRPTSRLETDGGSASEGALASPPGTETNGVNRQPNGGADAPPTKNL
jgi:hypothetical protein